jgi:hypothetical protein
MQPRKTACYAALTVFVGGALHAGAASASTLTLTCELLSTGTNPSCPATAPTYAVPGQYNYQNSFSAPTGATSIAGSNIYGGALNGNLGPAGFIDDYFFQISTARADVVSATIDLGGVYETSGLFARIYNLAANPGGLVTTTPNGAVDYGTITPEGPVTLVQINPTTLSSGSYVLELSGTASGSLGGSYTGTLNLNPVPAVPLPAALPLLLSGITLLGGLARRRSESTA